jgi:uncharacterized membrane protein
MTAMLEAPTRTRPSPSPALTIATGDPDQPSWRSARRLVVRRRPGFAGTVGALVLFCLSLTPSLLPRHWALQGVVSGLTMAIGYGAGATVGGLARTAWPRLPAAPVRAWAVLVIVGTVLAVVFLGLGAGWQVEVRELVGAGTGSGWQPVPIVAVAAAVAALLVIAARWVRLATRRLAATFGRFSPRPVASVAAVGVVVALTYGVGQQVVFNGFVDVAEQAAVAANGITSPGLSPPSSHHVSGGPGSLVAWDTLGAYGREFTGTAVSRRELASFAGGEARPPVRVYIGRDSAPDLPAQARLAVRELERTGGFEREVLAVIITTGTGWVNPAVPAALEYLYGGDSATVAMQYSYLPSWISFVADRSRAADAADVLVGAVRERLSAMPEAERPQLLVYGESLGAHGVEAAFGGLAELLAATDGVLLAGPPRTSPIWQEVMAAREPGSPAWQPVYRDGDSVRFAQHGGDLPAGAGRPELVYLQNASDPVVFWSPELLYRKPDWLEGRRGPDVSGDMTWVPVVTFWQVTIDLMTSTRAPGGHGHSYRETIADGWAALAAPPGWTESDTARLRTMLPPDS